MAYNLKDLARGKAPLVGAAKSVLEAITPTLESLKETKLNKFPYTSYEDVVSLLWSMIHCYIAPSIDRNTGKKVRGYMFDEIEAEPDGDSGTYGQLSYSLVKRAIENKGDFNTPDMDYFSAEEFWAVYILVRLEQYANLNDSKHLDLAHQALLLSYQPVIEQGKHKILSNKKGGETTGKIKKEKGEETANNVELKWNNLDHIGERNRASIIAQALDISPATTRHYIKKLGLKEKQK